MKNLLGRRKSGLLMLTQPFLTSKLINKTLRIRVVAHLHVLLLCFSSVTSFGLSVTVKLTGQLLVTRKQAQRG